MGDVDLSQFIKTENVEVARQQGPLQLRPQLEKERNPDYYQRSQEKERGGSDWSGSSWGGRGR